MRTLLLAAKFIATQQKSDTINIIQLKSALHCVQVKSGEKNQLIYNTLLAELNSSIHDVDDVVSEYKPLLTENLLTQIGEVAIVPFSQEVSKLLKKVPKNDFIPGTFEARPIFELSKADNQFFTQLHKFEALRETLAEDVFGQDQAIEEMIDSLVKNIWSTNKNSPKGMFLFLGPPATGKTFLAERFAFHLNDGYKLLSIDMAQYTNANEAFGLVGGKKSYDQSQPGKLTQFVKENRKSIILFDEFEKAHTQVLLSLLQLLSTGFVNDEHTEERIDCRETIVIFTSNLGRRIYNNPNFLSLLEDNSHQARHLLMTNVAQETKIERDHTVKAIPAELMSRLSQGSILLFEKLKLTNLVALANRRLKQDIQSFSEHSGIQFTLPTEYICELLLLSFSPALDIREIQSRISSLLIDPVTDFIRLNKSENISHIEVSVNSDVVSLLQGVDLDELQQKLRTKRQSISFSTQCELQQNKLSLFVKDVKQHKVINADDVGGNGGISVDIPSVSFSDIAGHDYIKTRLMETVQILKNRQQIQAQNISAPAGLILYGPPGTGKTMLAKAVANETDLPFIACTGPDLLSDKFIVTLFERARVYAPCIIFIDEIDALPKRGTAGSFADALVNNLLTEIDGFNTMGQEIFVIAATNHIEKLDPALTRSGRLDLKLQVPHLDKKARRWFVEKLLAHALYCPTIDIERILFVTAGLSGADLEKVHREASLSVIREGHGKIDEDRLVEEVNILKFGLKSEQTSSQFDLEETAYHEAGHAVLSKILMPERIIEQISVVARENSLGMVSYDRDQTIDYTKDFWFSLTCVALAGRAAQVKQYTSKGLDVGAGEDLKQAMHCAWMATVRYGMHEDSYNMDIASLQEWSSQPLFQNHIETLLKDWIESATKQTDILVEKHWSQIEAVAIAVLEKEIIGESELCALINDN